MARYKMIINNDNYKCARCSKKNWEAGTKNDYMLAINGITRTLNSMKEVMWQIELFRGNYSLSSEYIELEGKWSDKYEVFLKRNRIKYYDRLCGFEREQYLSGYGFMQGYFNIDRTLNELQQNGKVKIPFKNLYDLRQYDKNMNGCYMEIIKI